MNLCARILSHTTVLSVQFEDKEHYRLRLYHTRYQAGKIVIVHSEAIKDVEIEKKWIAQTPILLLCSGYGIIHKHSKTSPEIIVRVKSDADRFYYSESHGEETFSFIQRSQLEPLLNSFRQHGISPLRVECVGDLRMDEGSQIITQAVATFYRERMTIKDLVKPSICSSAICSLLARKIQLPVLLVILFLLIGNHFLAESISSKQQRTQAQVAILKVAAGKQNEQSEQRSRIFEQFRRGSSFRHALLCDRLAAAIPPSVHLTALQIQPPAKNIVPNHPLELRENMVFISGESTDMEQISQLTMALNQEKMLQEIRIEQIEQSKESGLFQFKITAQL